jgi:hypothetical protein
MASTATQPPSGSLATIMQGLASQSEQTAIAVASFNYQTQSSFMWANSGVQAVNTWTKVPSTMTNPNG